MKTIRCDPKSARFRFATRYLVDGAVLITVFGCLFFLLKPISGSFIAWAAGTSVAFCLHFFILPNRVIEIACPSCTKIVQTNTPWLCGFNNCRNENADEFPFVGECGHCHTKPKAYLCHHENCGELIFFTDDEQKLNYAQCLNFPIPNSEKTRGAQQHQERVEKAKQAAELRRKQVEEAELKAQLKDLKQSVTIPKKKSLEAEYLDIMKDDDDEAQLRKRIDEEFKGDEKEWKRRHAALDKALRMKKGW